MRNLGRQFLLILLVLLPLTVRADDPGLLRGAPVILMRHANAPGVGDPADFRLEDCATQRNLDDRGRQQAMAAGKWLAARGLRIGLVHSSRWCRALETARLLDLAPVTPAPAFDSFFGARADQTAAVEAMRDWLRRHTATRPLLIVTHQVNITALSGVFPASGEIVVLDRRADGSLAPRGRALPD